MVQFSKWQLTCGPIVPDPSMEEWEYERIEWPVATKEPEDDVAPNVVVEPWQVWEE